MKPYKKYFAHIKMDEAIEVDIYNTLEGALFEITGNTILWALCSMLEAGRSKKRWEWVKIGGNHRSRYI